MTEENRRENARREIEEARNCLAEARALRNLGHVKGTISRAYYVVLHAARAILLSVGVEPRTHKGVSNRLGDLFVRPGLLSADLGRLLSDMQRRREDADYQTGAVFTQDHAKEAVASAEAFLGGAERLLEGDGPD